MKAIIKINEENFLVSSFTRKGIEQKIKKVICENIFDPYGYIYEYELINKNKIKTQFIDFVDIFAEDEVLSLGN